MTIYSGRLQFLLQIISIVMLRRTECIEHYKLDQFLETVYS